MMNDIVERLPLLREFSEDQIEVLLPLIEETTYRKGEVIFKQGGQAKYLYFVLDGEVSIRFNPDDGSEITVADVREGDIFGWSAAMGSQMYTSGAICTESGHFFRVEGENLKTLCREYPETGILVLNQLAGVIAQRLRGTHQQVVELLHHGLNGHRSHQEAHQYGQEETDG